MWYLAELMFAEPPAPERAEYQCEVSNVVFEADCAADAYRKAVTWGLGYAAEPPVGTRLIGVSHLTSIGQELKDGTEICGRFFEVAAVWDRVAEFVPSPDHLKAILWEQSQDIPLGELLTPEQIARIERVSGQ